MPSERQKGPVEEHLRVSVRPDIRKLCELSNTELLEYMDRLITSPGDELDEELFDAVQSLLDERAPIADSVDPHEAFLKFEERNIDVLNSRDTKLSEPSTYPKKQFKFRKCYQIAVAVLIACSALIVGAVASGNNPVVVAQDIGEVLVRTITWGPSGRLTIPDTLTGYSSLEEALSNVGADNAQSITWVPEDYSLESIDVRSGEHKEFELWAFYRSNDGKLVFNISRRGINDEVYFTEKNEGNTPEEYNNYGMSIIENNGWLELQWSDGEYNYSLTGTEEKNVMKKVAQSAHWR